jgi:hypothetical protein
MAPVIEQAPFTIQLQIHAPTFIRKTNRPFSDIHLPLRERDCTEDQWIQTDDALTVPDFLNNHFYSFRNINSANC